MVQRIGGFRRKTRGKLTKAQKGRIIIANFLRGFKEGDKVSLAADPAYQKGMYHPRFHGQTGIIKGKEGSCYKVEIIDGNKAKNLIVHPVHLRKK